MDSANIITWFSNNSMIANPEKFQLTFIGKTTNYESLSINVGKEKFIPSSEVKLLGVTIDKELNFSKHIKYDLLKGQK